MKALRSRWSEILGVVLAMLLLGCSGDDGSSPTEPSPMVDTIVVESISPPPGSPLRAGSPVTFRARVRYELVSAGSGRVALVIQDQLSRNISPTIPQPSAQVARGSGTVELADTINLAASGATSVHVFFPLLPTGAPRSTAAQQVIYSVR
jgi:hypothetical protein